MSNRDVVRGMSGIDRVAQGMSSAGDQFSIPGAGLMAIGETPTHRGRSAASSALTIAVDSSSEKK